MNHEVILDTLKHLSPPSAEDEYTMYPVIADLFYLGKTYEGHSCVLLQYPPGVKLSAGRKTKGLALKYYNENQFTVNGLQTGSSWAVVTCLDENSLYVFSVLSEGVYGEAEAGRMASPTDILEYVSEWQDLLASCREMDRKQLIGLWGELFFICSSGNIEKAVSCWYGPEAKKFDFSSPGSDIEVKTSLKGHYHTFSWDQLSASKSGCERHIFSIYAQEDLSGGLTVNDLADKIRADLIKVDLFEKKLLSAGYSGPVENETKLNEKSLTMVAVDDVPKVISTDPGVYNVHFESDLTFCNKSDIQSVIRKFIEG
ncbi:MAG: PD-(D/E)XK motif protein [Candidatus Saccharibacteria bacterium]